MCLVSVIIPVYNSSKYLKQAIKSVQDQTYQNWELIAINEFGSNDGSADIVKSFMKNDKRIHLVQNEERLGLAESLNKGFRLAHGEYLARLDADDLAHETRFEKQVSFMEEHPEVGICGTYQHHFGENVNWIHRPPVTSDECKASLLFGCDICHSTLMLRKASVDKYHLFYDKEFLAEDYELWTRAVRVVEFANIPEVLGEYRVGDDNITNEKKEKLNIESGEIVAANLKSNLNFIVPKEKVHYFEGWENPLSQLTLREKDKALCDIQQILRDIINANKEIGFYDQECLLNVIASKWNWLKYGTEWNQKFVVKSVDEIFDEQYLVSLRYRYRVFKKNNPTLKQQLQCMGRKTLSFLASPFTHMLNWRMDHIEKHICDITWDRYGRSVQHIENITKNLEKMLSDTETKFESNIQDNCDELIKKIDWRIWKSELLVQDTIRRKTLEFGKAFSLPKIQKKIILLGAPNHSNLGDHAQTYCIEQLLKEQYAQYLLVSFDINQERDYDYSELFLALKERMTSNDIILIQSGMHLTDVYQNEQNMLMQALKVFREYKIVVLPQTMFYLDDENKRKFLLYMASFDNIMFYAREKHTFDEVKKYLKGE